MRHFLRTAVNHLHISEVRVYIKTETQGRISSASERCSIVKVLCRQTLHKLQMLRKREKEEPVRWAGCCYSQFVFLILALVEHDGPSYAVAHRYYSD